MRKYSLLSVSWLFVFIWFQDLPLHTGQPIMGSSWGEATSPSFSRHQLPSVPCPGLWSWEISLLQHQHVYWYCRCLGLAYVAVSMKDFCRRRFDILALLILLSLPICSLSHICEGHDVNVSTGARAPQFYPLISALCPVVFFYDDSICSKGSRFDEGLSSHLSLGIG